MATVGSALSACGSKGALGGPGSDAAPGLADSDASVEVFGPRPYYVVGHNPNSIPQVIAALDAGANGIEPDINVFADGSGRLCVSHDRGDSTASTLEQFLIDLHAVALARPQLALVVLDCKPDAVSPANGALIRALVREHLTYDLQIAVIISVSSLASISMFDLIHADLAAREGLMIDEENDPAQVGQYFIDLGVTNQGFGNGISIASCGILGPNVRPSMEQACATRAAHGWPRFIYVWTINCPELEREYIDIGVDGMITNDVAEVVAIVRSPEYAAVVRMATRDDNPFEPANFAYALIVKTADLYLAGTDSFITFTLTGSLGSVQKIINSELIKRMERDGGNFVTLQTPDLGVLQTITVSHDDRGNGPDWYLDWIEVVSARYGVNVHVVFDQWINAFESVSRSL